MQAAGDDLCRAAFFLFDAGVEALAPVHRPDPALSLAMIAMLLGVNQMRHRHIRGLMSQPRYVGRMFRDYYGFEVDKLRCLDSRSCLGPQIPREAELIQKSSFSFQDLNAMAVKKALAVAGILLRAGAIPSYQIAEGGGKTPLMHCASLDMMEVAALLLKSGAEPDSVNAFGQTALHVAVVHRSHGVVQKLLEYGVDATTRDHFGRSANVRSSERRTPAMPAPPGYRLYDWVEAGHCSPASWHHRSWGHVDRGCPASSHAVCCRHAPPSRSFGESRTKFSVRDASDSC